eukprot:508066_1
MNNKRNPYDQYCQDTTLPTRPYHLNDSKATLTPNSLVVFFRASANGPCPPQYSAPQVDITCSSLRPLTKADASVASSFQGMYMLASSSIQSPSVVPHAVQAFPI